MRITLEISAGPEVGRRIWLGVGQSLAVGRTELAEFSVPGDSLLSSVHFQVAWQDGGFRLSDLKSTNGTKLNGERIQEAPLQSGDVIFAGKTQFAVFLETDAPPPVNSPAPTVSLKDSAADSSSESPAELLVVNNRTPLSVICLPWQNVDGAGRLTVIVKATFHFTESAVRIAEVQLPIWFADQHEDDDPQKPVRYEADTAPFKPHADVVLVGKAYAPGGRPRTTVDVRIRVGGLNRRLRVFGDRRWLFPTRLAMVPQITDPVPFTQMPLTYARAFGGIDKPAAKYCAENLSGVGFIGEPSPTSIHDKPLPNIEDPDHLIGSWEARPKPAGFGFYGRGWQPRLKYLGTYDDAYRRNRSPLWPEDFSYEFHNGAHPDLQVAGFLEGDEQVELENLTRDGYAKFTLPGIQPRITLTRYISARTKVNQDSGIDPQIKNTERPVKPFFDSLVFIPDERLVYAVFRAVFAVQDIENPAIAEIHIDSTIGVGETD